MANLPIPGTMGSIISTPGNVCAFYQANLVNYVGVSGNFAWDTLITGTSYVTFTPGNTNISLNSIGTYVCKFRCGFQFQFSTSLTSWPTLYVEVFTNGSLYRTPYGLAMMSGYLTNPTSLSPVNISADAPVVINVTSLPFHVNLQFFLLGPNTGSITSTTSPTAASTGTTYGLSYSSIRYYG